MNVSFDNDEVIDRVVNDFNTKESAVKHLFLNTYDCIKEYSKLGVSITKNELKIHIKNSGFNSDDLERTLNNIGSSVNSDKTYTQGKYGLGTLSYLKIFDEVIIEGDGRKFIITRNGYTVNESDAKSDTYIILKNIINDNPEWIMKLDKIIQSCLSNMQVEPSDDKKIFNSYQRYGWCNSYIENYDDKNSFNSYHTITTDYTKIGDRVDVNEFSDYGVNASVENDYYFATTTHNNRYKDFEVDLSHINDKSTVYLNNIPLLHTGDKLDFDYLTDDLKFDVYLKTDKYINNDDVVTADISASNLKIKNYEELISNVKNKLRSRLCEKYNTFNVDDVPDIINTSELPRHFIQVNNLDSMFNVQGCSGSFVDFEDDEYRVYHLKQNWGEKDEIRLKYTFHKNSKYQNDVYNKSYEEHF